MRSNDHTRAKATPRNGRRRAGPEASVASRASCFGSGEQRLHRALPVQAERRNSDCAAQGFERVLRRVEEGIDLGDRHALGAVRELLDAIAGAELAFLNDAEIKAGPAVRNQQRRYLRMLQPDADPVAGVAWLADLYDGTADPEAIADADLGIGEALHCEVLAEVPGDEIRPPEIARPVAVGSELVYQERTLLAAMGAEIRLAVAIEVQPASENPPRDRLLPDRRPDSPV